MNIDFPWVYMIAEEDLDDVGEKDLNLILILNNMHTGQ